MSTGDPEIHGGRLSAAPCRGWPECPRCNARRTRFCAAAPTPPADAVTDAMVEAALDACAREGDEPWRQLPEEVVAMLKVDMRAAIAAALAAKEESND